MARRALRVLLVYPPVTLHRGDPSAPVRPTLLGLCYLGAAVRNAGHVPGLLDGFASDPCPEHTDEEATRFGLGDDALRERIRAFAPDVVGVSAMYTACFHDAHHVAKLARQEAPGARIVFGGTHATALPEVVLRDPNVDLVVIGEGEATFAEVLGRIAAGQGLDGVAGVAHRSASGVTIEPPRPPVEDLDTLPFPARDLLEDHQESIQRDHSENRYLMRRPLGYVQTSRGCPHNCYFCSFVIAFGRRWRARSARNVVDEIEALVRDHGYREIHLVDDNCSVSKARMLEMCDELLRRGLRVKIATPSGISIRTLDEEVLRRMKQAGFYRLCFGIETGDQASQELIDKRVDLSRARETIALANRLGFWTAATFILGHPHEGEEEVRATIEFAKRCGIDFAVFAILVPQFGTRAFDVMKEQGLVEYDVGWVDPANPEWQRIAIAYAMGSRTARYTNPDLHRLRAAAYREFLIHKVLAPRTYLNVLAKIRSLEDLAYVVRMAVIPARMLLAGLAGRFVTYLPTQRRARLRAAAPRPRGS